MDGEQKRLNPQRLQAAMAARGIESQAELGRRLGLQSTTVNRWVNQVATPYGEHLAALCRELQVSSDYLFGDEPSDERREKIIAEIRQVFGRAAADAVRDLSRLTPHHRAMISGRIHGWAEALEAEERAAKMPRMPIDEDRERLLAVDEPPSYRQDPVSAPRGMLGEHDPSQPSGR